MKKIYLNVLFSSTFKKAKKMAEWQNHFSSGKQFQKGQMATLMQMFVFEQKKDESGTKFFLITSRFDTTTNSLSIVECPFELDFVRKIF